MFSLADQIWTLMLKNLLIVVVQRPLSTTIRAIIIPLAIALIVAYSQYFFNPQNNLGAGVPSPVLPLSQALAQAGARANVVFVDNGHVGGSISSIINGLSQTVKAAGKNVQLLPDYGSMTGLCATSRQGVSDCFAGVEFFSSPSEPVEGGIWNYSISIDSSLGHSIDVSSESNDAQIFMLPLQHAIDSAISSQLPLANKQFNPVAVNQYPITAGSNQVELTLSRENFLYIFITVFGIIFFFCMMGVLFHLPAFMASERELGMSQLIDAMIPANSHWQSQFARLSSTYFTFTLLYLPSWLVTGIVLSTMVFTNSSAAMIILYHFLCGLALCSYSLLGASFFKRAQLSGTYIAVIALVLAIISQVLPDNLQTKTTVLALSLLFPSANYGYFMAYVARWELVQTPTNLSQSALGSPWSISGSTLIAFLVIQVLLYPILATCIERVLFGTTSKGHRFVETKNHFEPTVKLNAFSRT